MIREFVLALRATFDTLPWPISLLDDAILYLIIVGAAVALVMSVWIAGAWLIERSRIAQAVFIAIVALLAVGALAAMFRSLTEGEAVSCSEVGRSGIYCE